MLVRRRRNGVDAFECGHQRRDARVDRRLEWRQVDLAQRALRHLRAVVVAPRLRRAVRGVVFGAGENARALESAHVRRGHGRAEHRIFAGAFGDASPARVARDVHHGREGPADPFRARFRRAGARGELGHLRVPRRGDGQRNGKDGAIAVDDVVAEQQRDLRMCQGLALQRVRLLRAAGVEQRSDASVLERRSELRPILHQLRQLPQLLFEAELRRIEQNPNGQQPTANGQHGVSLQYAACVEPHFCSSCSPADAAARTLPGSARWCRRKTRSGRAARCSTRSSSAASPTPTATASATSPASLRSWIT